MEAISRRWRGIYTPSSRCSYEDDVASMAWGVRNFIFTQVGELYDCFTARGATVVGFTDQDLSLIHI